MLKRIAIFLIFSAILSTFSYGATLQELLNQPEIEKLCNNFAREYKTLVDLYKKNGQTRLMNDAANELINEGIRQSELDFLYGVAENNDQQSVDGLQGYVFNRAMLAEDIGNGDKTMEYRLKDVAIAQILRLTKIAQEHGIITDQKPLDAIIQFMSRQDLCAKRF